MCQHLRLAVPAVRTLLFKVKPGVSSSTCSRPLQIPRLKQKVTVLIFRQQFGGLVRDATAALTILCTAVEQVNILVVES